MKSPGKRHSMTLEIAACWRSFIKPARAEQETVKPGFSLKMYLKKKISCSHVKLVFHLKYISKLNLGFIVSCLEAQPVMPS